MSELLAAVVGGIIVSAVAAWHSHWQQLVIAEWDAAKEARRLVNQLLEKHRFSGKRTDPESGVREFFAFASGKKSSEGMPPRHEQLDNAVYEFVDFLSVANQKGLQDAWADARYKLIDGYDAMAHETPDELCKRFDAVLSPLQHVKRHLILERSRRWWGLVPSRR